MSLYSNSILSIPKGFLTQEYRLVDLRISRLDNKGINRDIYTINLERSILS